MSKPLKMDWLRMESRIREALRNWKKDDQAGRGREEATATIFLIDAIIGDETGRGYELEDLDDTMEIEDAVFGDGE